MNKITPITKRYVSISCIFFLLIFTANNKSFSQNTANTNPLRASDLSISEDIGTIDEVHDTNSQREKKCLIIYLQDAHCIFEAQNNIAKIIDEMQRNYGLDMVALEAADGKMDPTFYRTFPVQGIKEKVIDSYVKRGVMTGAEKAAICNEKEAVFEGVENMDVYYQNKKALVEAMEKEDAINKNLWIVEKYLKQLSRRIFAPELKELYKKKHAYDNESLGLIEYVKYLMSKVNDASKYGMINKLLEADERDKEINNDAVDKNAIGLVKEVERRIKTEGSEEALERFQEKYSLYSQDDFDRKSFMVYLINLAKRRGIILDEEYQLVLDYIAHVREMKQIRGEELFLEMDELFSSIKEKYFTGENDRALDERLHNLDILKKMSKLELAREDLAYYTQNKDKFSDAYFADFILQHADMGGDILDNFGALFVPHEKFYQVALKRDKTMHDRLIEIIRHEDEELIMVITGGFHTDGIKKMLKGEGYSYVVMSPKITNFDIQNAYHDVMTGKVPFAEFKEGMLGREIETIVNPTGAKEAIGQSLGAKLAAESGDAAVGLWEWENSLRESGISPEDIAIINRIKENLGIVAKDLTGAEVEDLINRIKKMAADRQESALNTVDKLTTEISALGENVDVNETINRFFPEREEDVTARSLGLVDAAYQELEIDQKQVHPAVKRAMVEANKSQQEIRDYIERKLTRGWQDFRKNEPGYDIDNIPILQALINRGHQIGIESQRFARMLDVILTDARNFVEQGHALKGILMKYENISEDNANRTVGSLKKNGYDIATITQVCNSLKKTRYKLEDVADPFRLNLIQFLAAMTSMPLMEPGTFASMVSDLTRKGNIDVNGFLQMVDTHKLSENDVQKLTGYLLNDKINLAPLRDALSIYRIDKNNLMGYLDKLISRGIPGDVILTFTEDYTDTGGNINATVGRRYEPLAEFGIRNPADVIDLFTLGEKGSGPVLFAEPPAAQEAVLQSLAGILRGRTRRTPRFDRGADYKIPASILEGKNIYMSEEAAVKIDELGNVTVNGWKVGQLTDASPEIVLGRKFVPYAQAVSRRHLQIRKVGASYVLRDLNSKNGVRMDFPQALEPNFNRRYKVTETTSFEIKRGTLYENISGDVLQGKKIFVGGERTYLTLNKNRGGYWEVTFYDKSDPALPGITFEFPESGVLQLGRNRDFMGRIKRDRKNIDATISRYHLKIILDKNGNFTLQDMDSTRGTRIENVNLEYYAKEETPRDVDAQEGLVNEQLFSDLISELTSKGITSFFVGSYKDKLDQGNIGQMRYSEQHFALEELLFDSRFRELKDIGISKLLGLILERLGEGSPMARPQQQRAEPIRLDVGTKIEIAQKIIDEGYSAENIRQYMAGDELFGMDESTKLTFLEPLFSNYGIARGAPNFSEVLTDITKEARKIETVDRLAYILINRNRMTSDSLQKIADHFLNEHVIGQSIKNKQIYLSAEENRRLQSLENLSPTEISQKIQLEAELINPERRYAKLWSGIGEKFVLAGVLTEVAQAMKTIETSKQAAEAAQEQPVGAPSEAEPAEAEIPAPQPSPSVDIDISPDVIADRNIREVMQGILASETPYGYEKKKERFFTGEFDLLVDKLGILDAAFASNAFDGAVKSLEEYSETERPRDSKGKPGSLLKIEQGKKLLPIADLHGRFDTLMEILRDSGALRSLAEGKNDFQIVFTGDSIHPAGMGKLDVDVNVNSLRTFALIAMLKKAFPKNVHYLPGNHDYAHIEGQQDVVKGFAPQNTLMNEKVIEKFGERGKQALSEMTNFFANSPLAAKIKIGDRYGFAVHAGGSPFVGSEQDLVDILNMEGGQTQDNKAILNKEQDVGETPLVQGRGGILWDRIFAGSEDTRFLRAIGCDFIIHGHTHIIGETLEGRRGVKTIGTGATAKAAVVNNNRIVFDHTFDEVAYSVIDLEQGLPPDLASGLQIRTVKGGPEVAAKSLGSDVFSEFAVPGPLKIAEQKAEELGLDINQVSRAAFLNQFHSLLGVAFPGDVVDLSRRGFSPEEIRALFVDYAERNLANPDARQAAMDHLKDSLTRSFDEQVSKLDNIDLTTLVGSLIESGTGVTADSLRQSQLGEVLDEAGILEANPALLDTLASEMEQARRTGAEDVGERTVVSLGLVTGHNQNIEKIIDNEDKAGKLDQPAREGIKQSALGNASREMDDLGEEFKTEFGNEMSDSGKIGFDEAAFLELSDREIVDALKETGDEGGIVVFYRRAAAGQPSEVKNRIRQFLESDAVSELGLPASVIRNRFTAKDFIGETLDSSSINREVKRAILKGTGFGLVVWQSDDLPRTEEGTVDVNTQNILVTDPVALERIEGGKDILHKFALLMSKIPGTKEGEEIRNRLISRFNVFGFKAQADGTIMLDVSALVAKLEAHYKAAAKIAVAA